ncbi:DUF6348 family protein [Hymenobacter endophyticus]|uniref:DUF6348 family protein n=1 Tax=Hymenobacter endophyticus TaxID=3076335 RepID=A0ABU3TDZ4_9BACT|nr:DUF6348 family protein [Hymenobacter endophyticus]MDU0369596.1 DUF6348 family protein [Hymenobacter endophyticus]
MNWLRKLRGLLLPAPSPNPTPAALPASPRPPESVLRQELLLQLPAQFGKVRVVPGATHLDLEPYGLTLEWQVLDQARHAPTPERSAIVMLTLGFRLSHPQFFPTGIVECLAGIGTDDTDAIRKGVNNFCQGLLALVLDGLDGHHQPALNIVDATGQVQWHPLTGLVQVQGSWSARIDDVDEQHYFELLRPHLRDQLMPQPFHWLKLYASRQPDGEFIGECHWNNEPWDEGLQLLAQDTQHWPDPGTFAGWKQYLLFRHCGSGDTQLPFL